MKNISGALNAVLIVAVAILFYLHFSGNKPVDVAVTETEEITKVEEKIIDKKETLKVDSLSSLCCSYERHNMRDILELI